MAPSVTLHIFANNDLNGPVIAEITDEDPYFKRLKLKLERDGLGGAELLLARSADLSVLDADAFDAEYFVRVLVHAYSDTAYYPWGFFFSKRQLTTVHVNEKGAEEFLLGGPGPKQYLTRGILGIGTPNTGWNLDLANGVWRWGDSATVGTILGQIIGQDAAEDDPAFPDLTRSFNASTDSNGVDWADTDISGSAEQYRIPIGTSLLQALWDLDDIVELTSWVDLGAVGEPEFRLNVIQGLGTDYTGTAVGSDVCLLKEGLNITNDSLIVEGVSLKKASHVVVEGLDGKWAEAVRPSFTPGDYVKRVKIEYRRSVGISWLEKAGIRWLKRQDYGEKALEVEVLPGDDDTTGGYFPAPDRVLWLANLISVDTRTDGATQGHLDIAPSEDQLVSGIDLELGPVGDTTDALTSARSWEVTAHLNQERPGNVPGTPNQSSAGNNGGGGGGGNDPRPIALCDVGTDDIPAVDEETTLLKFFDANDAGGDSLSWVGILANQGGSPGQGAEGSSYYYFKSTAPNEWSQSYGSISPGQHARITGYFEGTAGERLKFGFFTDSVGTNVTSATLISAHTLRTGPASAWTAFSVDLIAPTGTVSWALGRDGGGPSFDRVRVYTVDTEGEPEIEGDPGDCPEPIGTECSPGTGSKAARCDHVHEHGTVLDAHHLNPPTITDAVSQFTSASTSCAVTVAAPAVGANAVAIVHSTGRGANSLTQTNVTWTKRYSGNGNNQWIEVWTGVVAGGAGGTTLTAAFTGSNNQEVHYFLVPSESNFTACSAVVTGTGSASAVARVNSGGLTIGNLYIAACSAAAPTFSTNTLSQPWVHIIASGGQGRDGMLRAMSPRLAYWSESSSAVNNFIAILSIS